jgi:hypothetical protein
MVNNLPTAVMWASHLGSGSSISIQGLRWLKFYPQLKCSIMRDSDQDCEAKLLPHSWTLETMYNNKGWAKWLKFPVICFNTVDKTIFKKGNRVWSKNNMQCYPKIIYTDKMLFKNKSKYAFSQIKNVRQGNIH